MGDDIKTTVIENLISDQQPYQCALLIYTVNDIVCIFTFLNHCYVCSLGPLVIPKL